MDQSNLNDYKLGGVGDWAALVFAQVFKPTPRTDSEGEIVADRKLLGYIFVIEPKRRNAVWKFPGGHQKKGDRCKEGQTPDRTPLDTAAREFEGETGIKLSRNAFEYAGKWLHERGDHWKILFTAELTEADVPWMHDRHEENEGEQSKFFTREELDEVVAAGKFMPEHYDKLVELGLVLPGPALEAQFA